MTMFTIGFFVLVFGASLWAWIGLRREAVKARALARSREAHPAGKGIDFYKERVLD